MRSTSGAVAKAFSLDAFARFSYLWAHAQSLIRLHVYTTRQGSKIFTQAGQAPSSPSTPSKKVFAYSLAVAQDCSHTPQPAGPANDDLQFFKLLWNATTDVFEKMLEEANLDLEVCGWGVNGLTAGYTELQTTSAAEKTKFIVYKGRLKAALNSLPSLSSPHSSPDSGVTPHRRVFMLTKARREVNICSNMLLQQFRSEGWTIVRWYHGIAVAESWVGNLNMRQALVVTEEEVDN
ncbi:hypothetical protein BU23DRAFT_564819 [Bimuria novae-zelandiae CBS 107.79]|uniref:Uncharacterized protein n=1 Tax=Bimuria novae-zelandiae CBS 107.79 TaxID=1447943 RepID=A0A6A5VL35_9PLEO|nr:hypothetical protein BU23DRAFT_564819 [Bimuria novae-zelandiae CBS 107.79]